MYEYKLWYKLFVFSLHFYMLCIFTLVYTIYTWYTRIIERNSLTVYWSIGVFSRYFYLHSIWRYLNICSEGASMYLLNYFFILRYYIMQSRLLYLISLMIHGLIHPHDLRSHDEQSQEDGHHHLHPPHLHHCDYWSSWWVSPVWWVPQVRGKVCCSCRQRPNAREVVFHKFWSPVAWCHTTSRVRCTASCRRSPLACRMRASPADCCCRCC